MNDRHGADIGSSEIAGLLDAIELAEADVGEAGSLLRGLGDAVGDATDGAEGDGAALLTEVDAARTELEDQASAAARAFAAARERVAEMVATGRHELEVIRKGLQDTHDRIDDLEAALQGQMDLLAQAHGDLIERCQAATAEIGAATAATEQYLRGDVAESLERCRSLVADQAELVRQSLQGEVTPAVQQAVARLVEQLQGLAEQLSGRGQQGVATLSTSTVQLLGDLQGRSDEALGQLLAQTRDADELLEQLAAQVRGTGQQVTATKQVLAEGVATANTGLETALGLLRELRELFGRFV